MNLYMLTPQEELNGLDEHDRSLASREIHLWFCCGTTWMDLFPTQALKDILSCQEYEKHQKFRCTKAQKQYAQTRIMLRTLLSHYEPTIFPQAWHFVEGPYGKPYVANFLSVPLFFNVTHTENLVVVALSRYPSLGIDAEHIHKQRPILDVASFCLTRQEKLAWDELDSMDKRKNFFSLWTMKEAWVKALGRGMSIPFDHFSVKHCIEKHHWSITDLDDIPLATEENWCFRQWLFQHDYILSLAIRIRPVVIRCHHFPAPSQNL